MSQTLLQYLSVALPTIPIGRTAPSPNEPNPHYSADNITQIQSWTEFNYSTIIEHYGTMLNSKQIRCDPFSSPPASIQSEPYFRARVAELVMPRVRRALRAGFEQLTPELPARRLSPVTFDGGSAAAIIDDFRPDTAYVVVGSELWGSNRAPGTLNVSWKWQSCWRSSTDSLLHGEYKQALSQVNFYMNQHTARHGFILTNTELVAVKQLDRSGRLAVSTAIPWTAGGEGQLSVVLALWYIGMLAAEDENWSLKV
ncbi:hypothetical protein AbraIFM66951_001215 [Aspergillus brasiliensis]|uniref:Uncharacterized protein n=1 Tax=Aspergillus brasiliensis TaxID=319629 RepID=A0A9W6DPI5_9EURO|nr:hypothetical protein AbraCBS73388_009322 [Aspergillus brasiliensis]GKZ48967.1 hypothetical protein AbraIFM66951_001215 [Aspergillus brasiliensis]